MQPSSSDGSTLYLAASHFFHVLQGTGVGRKILRDASHTHMHALNTFNVLSAYSLQSIIGFTIGIATVPHGTMKVT